MDNLSQYSLHDSLFASLGFNWVKDSRGFAYFKTDQVERADLTQPADLAIIDLKQYH